MDSEKPLAARAGFVPVYAVAAGLAATLPMPVVDSWLARTARGSAMRRIAARHELTLAPEARKILGDIALPKDMRVRGYRVARAALQKTFFPMVPVNRVEDALSTLGSAVLFDAYLRHRPFPVGTRLEAADARAIRKVVDAALVQGASDIAVALPEVAKRVASQSYAIVRTSDAAGRARAEVLVDHLLDTIADLPENVMSAFELRLEQGLATARSER